MKNEISRKHTPKVFTAVVERLIYRTFSGCILPYINVERIVDIGYYLFNIFEDLLTKVFTVPISHFL